MTTNGDKDMLSLDRPAHYQIKVPGHLDESWSQWTGGLDILLSREGEGYPATILSGKVDQAALHGLLKKVRDLGMPLLSVICVKPGQADASDVKQ